MTTTLSNAEIELSKQMGDFWSSSATATVSNIKLTDTVLKDVPSDWLTDDTHLQMTTLNAAADTSERLIATLNITDGFVTWNRALAGNSTNADTYRIHRLFTASEKRRALINACKMAFPSIHERIWDESTTTATNCRISIINMGFAQHKPHEISIATNSAKNYGIWTPLRRWSVDVANGTLYHQRVAANLNVRIRGIGYLGWSAETWAGTINIDEPQLQILVAEAALYLCNQKSLPTETSGVSKQWMEAKANWEKELRSRKAQFGMEGPQTITQWGM
uniref:Uncharacterized protein n=1 Tax=viral metagenome TaxID=1070528 RepID=A0A6M3K6E9_9ZZZZ